MTEAVQFEGQAQIVMFTLRDASSTDVVALANLHVLTFRETHARWGWLRPGGRGPSREIRESQWSAILNGKLETDFTLVVESAEGQLVGFARGNLHDGTIPEFVGRLNKLYVLKRFQGLGIGATLLCGVAKRFQSHGISSMLLFGDARSSANGFFEHFGGERLLSPEGEFHGGYGWRRLDSLSTSCHNYGVVDSPSDSLEPRS